MAVARTQTLVQLSDELLATLDEKAAREGRSRSELIRQALEGFLREEREAEIDRAVVESYRRQPQEEGWGDVAARWLLEDEADGLPSRCALSFDNLATVPKALLVDRLVRLRGDRLVQVRAALRVATGC